MKFFKHLFFLFTAVATAQGAHTITGGFPQVAKKEIRLSGYDFNTMQSLSMTVADATGNFVLNYPRDFQGAAVLEIMG